MEFEFKDTRNWTYRFTVNETDLMFVNIISFDDQGKQVHKEDVAFFEDVFNWRPYHLRGNAPLISKEAREFCENKVKSFMKMKVFW